MAVDLIVDALVVGAAAGASATGTAAVTDAYGSLKAGVRRLLRRGSDSESDDPVAAVEADPDTGRDALLEALTAAGADRDAELVAAAQRVLELADPGKYRVEVRDSTGVQVGDGNSMTLNLGDQ